MSVGTQVSKLLAMAGAIAPMPLVKSPLDRISKGNKYLGHKRFGGAAETERRRLKQANL